MGHTHAGKGTDVKAFKRPCFLEVISCPSLKDILWKLKKSILLKAVNHSTGCKILNFSLHPLLRYHNGH